MQQEREIETNPERSQLIPGNFCPVNKNPLLNIGKKIF
jgi:hypothetical protein